MSLPICKCNSTRSSYRKSWCWTLQFGMQGIIEFNKRGINAVGESNIVVIHLLSQIMATKLLVVTQLLECLSARLTTSFGFVCSYVA